MGALVNNVHEPYTPISSPHGSDARDSSARPSPLLPRLPLPPPPTSDLRLTLLAPNLPAPVNIRPSMDVKSLIDFFNHKCKLLVEPPIDSNPVAIPKEPVLDLNGKVKYLVQEFSKHSRSLPGSNTHSLPTQSRVELVIKISECTPSIGGGPYSDRGPVDESGVPQRPIRGPRNVRQVSGQSRGAGHVPPAQSKDSERGHQKQEQQSQKPQETAVGMAKVVGRLVGAKPPPHMSGTRGSTTEEHRKHGDSSPSSRVHHPHQQQRSQAGGAAQRIAYSSATADTFEISKTGDVNADTEASSIGGGRCPYMSPAVTLLSTIQSRGDLALSPSKRRLGTSVESVVISARNSVVRKLKLTGLISHSPLLQDAVRIEQGDNTTPQVSLVAEDGPSISRLVSKSTDPPPLRIVEVKKVDTGTTAINYNLGYLLPAVPTGPYLAPPAQRYVDSEWKGSRQPPLTDYSLSSQISLLRSSFQNQKASSVSYADSGAEEEKEEEKAENTYDITLEPSTQTRPPSLTARPAPERQDVCKVNGGPGSHNGRSQSLSMPYFAADRNEKAYNTFPYCKHSAPRKWIYSDDEWRKHGSFVLRQHDAVDDGENVEEGPQSLQNTFDGLSISCASWSSLSSPRRHLDSIPPLPPSCPSPASQYLDPLKGQFRNFILNSKDTTGQYHHCKAKAELIRQLPHYAQSPLAEQVERQKNNPCFSTFHKQGGSSDAGSLALDISSPPTELRDLGYKPKSSRGRGLFVMKEKSLAEEARGTAAGGLISPTYVTVGGEICRVGLGKGLATGDSRK